MCKSFFFSYLLKGNLVTMKWYVKKLGSHIFIILLISEAFNLYIVFKGGETYGSKRALLLIWNMLVPML